jgi:GH3 auxin-responsive promoter
MIGRLRARAVTEVFLAGQRPGHRAFRRALARPEAAQAARLRRLLERNVTSAYGRRHGFGRIRTPREYQDAVPIVEAEQLVPWVERVKNGEPGVLTTEPVIALETTGGTTGPAKYVPYTASLLEEFHAALAAWMVDLYSHRPALRQGGAYWSISPSARAPEVTAGGLPVGLADDTDYFGRRERWALRRLLRAPGELAAVADMASSRYVTLRFLLDAEDLTFVSVWNPSFLTLLVGALQTWAPQLVDDVARGTLTPPVTLPTALQAALARRLRPRAERACALRALARCAGGLRAVDVWPHLDVISCWTSAAAALSLPELTALFPGVEVQGKGLLATEGVVTIPLVGQRGGAVAVTSHFYEFADTQAPRARPRLAHELEVGRRYTVILTTGGGLYRLALGDIVEVVGRVNATPLVEFIGRAGLVSDLTGEKLSEVHVAGVLDVAIERAGLRCPFLMLAPEWGGPPYYALFVEAPALDDGELDRLAAGVETGLCTSPSYAYSRRLGQLGPVRAVRLCGPGAAAYVRRCTELGQRAGVVKPAALHGTPGWSAHLPVARG